ncbi:MAG: helix-turn-helix transcriptional regulator [Mailhella sp.]|nr:helix-turn-helix transcriptional regulator [Mailhella sp.]
MEKNIDAFAPVLRQLRHGNDLTQEQLSEKLGVAAPYVSMLESGRKYPNLEMFFKIAQAFGIKPSQMMAEMEKRLGMD